MKKRNLLQGIVMALCLVVAGCNRGKQALPADTGVLFRNMDNLTQIIIYDVFTPPVATRIYTYASLAAYEAERYADSRTVSLSAQLRGFKPMPAPGKGMDYNYTLAASKAFYTVIQKMIFSQDTLKKFEAGIYDQYKSALEGAVYKRSLDLGEAIGNTVLARALADGYTQSRGKPKYLGSNDPGKWRPTPPDYLDGVEWCWNTMKTLVMDSAAQFAPPPPPKYTTDTSSAFYKYLKEVYDINHSLTDEQKTVARFWDDNPFVIEHSGHMMFGNKKVTPGGHWMNITGLVCRQSGADAVTTARAYALTAIAQYEAFIACWDAKYKTNVIRPVTVINEMLDPAWTPFLQTPPFPEYTSGHSAISSSAAVLLTAQFGDHFAFHDTTEMRYIGLNRSFRSFRDAASEVSISRVYGGIHYRSGVEAGQEQGRRVGEYIAGKLLGEKSGKQ